MGKRSIRRISTADTVIKAINPILPNIRSNKLRAEMSMCYLTPYASMRSDLNMGPEK